MNARATRDLIDKQARRTATRGTALALSSLPPGLTARTPEERYLARSVTVMVVTAAR